MKTILEAKQITKIYGKKAINTYTALHHLSFSMPEGEFIGIMGPSGSGKTTLLNIISTLDTPSEGKIMIDGNDISEMNQDQLSTFRSQRLGFVFQDYNLLENMTIFENIALPLSIQHVPANQITTKVIEIARKLEIESILSNYPSEVSGGQKQRTAVARALIHQPALILADEPTGALDSKNATALLEILSSINSEDGVSIIMVTHDPHNASYCKRLLFIQDGCIYKEVNRNGTPEDFYKEILEILAEMSVTS